MLGLKNGSGVVAVDFEGVARSLRSLSNAIKAAVVELGV